MSSVTDDPGRWTLINLNRDYTDYIAASSVVVAYDWALTFGQEVELVWLSLVRSAVLTSKFSSIFVFTILPSDSVTNKGCEIINTALWCTNFVVNCMLGVIMIIRLFAMHQQSRNVLIFLVVIFLAIMIACGVITLIEVRQILGEDLILTGTQQCLIGGNIRLTVEYWVLGTTWEVLALCFALWSAVKHFRELQRPWARWTIEDCFTVLIKTHMLYFVSFVAVSCFQLGYLSPTILYPTNVTTRTYGGILQILSFVQMFVLGPRLILDVRRYHAKLIAQSDTWTAMTTMVFHEHVQASTSSDV
ncbi:uncharacterized protein EDB93DRAFT_1288651 [Suillus bovinus]|uniref:uncharacterized protein n=1 Tax=Suillus bovinus TaxID=48563 RepID=UPI001B87351F|nr:uncharacterized protein EDB93DRAFT_1288651 [Suillus bovinus]KAG2145395.1 hypothetical protein EDB93DRAFT_1288651 [Suillus bovinus]